MNIGKNIKQVRVTKNLSQKEIISVAKLGAAQFSRIESGKTDPTVNTLEKIAKALGVKLGQLFFDDQNSEVKLSDKTVMEKVSLIEGLPQKDRKLVYEIIEAFTERRRNKRISEAIDTIKSN